MSPIRIALAAAMVFIAPNIASAQTCVKIYAYTLSDREVQIAEDIVGRVVRRPIPEGGVIEVCDGQENAFRQSLRNFREREADNAWASFVGINGGRELIRNRIEQVSGGSCPSILDRLETSRPNGSQPFRVTCNNNRVYQIGNWSDERNWEQQPLLNYLVIEEVR